MLIRHTLLILFALALMPAARSQCNHEWNINVALDELEIVQYSQTLLGELTDISFDVAFFDIDGGSWPSDLLVHVYAPNGNCVVWGGYTGMDIDGECQNLGTGFGEGWPNSWTSAGNQNVSYTLNLAAYNLGGTGTWTIELQNAWNTTNGTAAWDIDLTMFGLCVGDCTDEAACNYVAEPVLPNDDACLYALDLYPSGYYDCEGNCIGDFNGNGVCDNEEVFGCIYAESVNFDSLATADDGSCEPLCGLEIDCDLVYDGDGDLIVATGDLLGLLSEFGESCD